MNVFPTEKTIPAVFRSFRCLILCLSLAVCLTSSGRELALRVIQTTDLHGSIDHGALARTAAIVDRETAAAGGPGNSIRIDCGDLVQGSFAMTMPEGRALMIRVLNFLQFDVFIPGNHDFEFGSGMLLPLLRDFRGSVLALNLDWPESPVRPWRIFQRAGLNVAVIGIAYPSLDRMFLPEVMGKARQLPVAGQLERIIPEVMRARPDVIILALHAGEQSWLGPDFRLFDLIRKYPQIDLILCGHSHQSEAGAALGRSAWRMQAPAHAAGIAVADITFDTEKKRIVSMKSRIVQTDKVPEHPAVKKMVGPVRNRSFRLGRRLVAEVPSALRPPEKREYSSALTRLYGKAIMDSTGAEIVFYGVNSRFQTGPGTVSLFQLYRLMPFADHPVTVDLTADEIRRILEEQIAIHRKNGPYQAPTGITFAFSRRKLQSISLESTGRPLESGRLYRTAFSSYIFSGGGRCRTLHEIVKNKKYRALPQTTYEAVAAFLMKTYPAKSK